MLAIPDPNLRDVKPIPNSPVNTSHIIPGNGMVDTETSTDPVVLLNINGRIEKNPENIVNCKFEPT